VVSKKKVSFAGSRSHTGSRSASGRRMGQQPMGQKNSSAYLHGEEWPLFAAAGYTLANGGAFGLIDTILDNPTPPCPCDNIIVSANIKIKQVGRVADAWMNDHAILWADLAFE
jgi:hypothetical protein